MGVYVLGMHRSGTSAVTRVVNLLGVPIGREERLMPVQADNPAGFWEHLALMEVNDAVLARLGGAWDAPPAPAPHFGEDAAFADLRDRARVEFDATYDGDRWVFKDPRVSVLLPFWRTVLGARSPAHEGWVPGTAGTGHAGDVAIVVLRNPLDIAASLQRRNTFAGVYTFALWERYLRLALRDAHGLPVLVFDYDALLDDAASIDTLERFLATHGQVDGAAPRDDIRAFLAASLRHSRHDRDAFGRDARVTAEQRALHDVCARLVGAHDAFVAPALPDESPTTEPLLAAHRDREGRDAAARALDGVLRQLGEAEARAERAERDGAEARATETAVRDALGYTAIGRLERSALGAARRARGLQQRLRRR